MAFEIIYEWAFEETGENGDRVDTVFVDTFAEVADLVTPEVYRHTIALVRTAYDHGEDKVLHQAYVLYKNGSLPGKFQNGAEVPQQYLDETRVGVQ